MEKTNSGFRPSASVQAMAFLENVRKAEHLISAGEYELALQRLVEAHDSEPQNRYLPVLIQRVENLRDATAHSIRAVTIAEHGSRTYNDVMTASIPPMAVASPTAPNAEQPTESDHAIEARVKRLTVVATNLFERGSYEPAFQALVKAFLLAPTSGHVVECQKTLQPAIELLKKRGTIVGLEVGHSGPHNRSDWSNTVVLGGIESSMYEASGSRSLPQQPPRIAEELAMMQESRLELLKRQKERERSERERAMWRQASGPLRVYGQRIEEVHGTSETTESKENVKQQTGFFTKLRQGKFLG